MLEVPEFKKYYTLSNGCPVEDPLLNEGSTKTNGGSKMVSQLIQDLNVIDTISHITRERIPERFVHAKGVGAFGYFEVTNKELDVSTYSDAKFLNGKGKRTRVFARFSTVAGERGYPDTVRDLKGGAFKLYTEEGNLDWAFLNPEIFPIRDPAKFPSLVHATKRCPASNLLDANMGYNALMRVFSDEGTPKSYSRIKFSSVHCYTFTKKSTVWNRTLARIQLVPSKPDPDNDYFTLDQATTMAGKDPDWLARRLYDEITYKGPSGMEKPKFPQWIVRAQIVTEAGLDKLKKMYPQLSIFDATKTLPESIFPWQEFGMLTLDECPQNSFTQVEQAAFNPANVVPGWDISPDPVLQIRLFAYGDTQRYRLGVNNDQLPTNKPQSYVYTPTRRDGANNHTNYGNLRNYILADDQKIEPPDYNISFVQPETKGDWDIERFKTAAVNSTDWEQCKEHYNQLSMTQMKNFVKNVAASLATATKPTQQKALALFKEIDPNLSMDIGKEVQDRMPRNTRMAANALGVVAGAEEAGESLYVPPTAPDPSTGVVENIFGSV
ncbi:catalase-like domain-containing protein [Aspergillus carlsbadensis]|nr:catalase-like domain-containing protein [Aspergillus carlsbadensis]